MSPTSLIVASLDYYLDMSAEFRHLRESPTLIYHPTPLFLTQPLNVFDTLQLGIHKENVLVIKSHALYFDVLWRLFSTNKK